MTRIASIPVLGPETAADEFTIGGTIQSKKTSQYLNIATASTSYKPLVWGATGETTAWGLEGDTIITVQSSSYGRRKYLGKRHVRLIVGGANMRPRAELPRM